LERCLAFCLVAVCTQLGAYASQENIAIFIAACKKIGFRNSDLFSPGDLFQGKNLGMV
jgi:hypothetical protein